MTATTQLRIPDDDAAWLKEAAAKRHTSMNQVIVDAIERERMAEAAQAYNEISRARDPETELSRWRGHRAMIKQEQQRP